MIRALASCALCLFLSLPALAEPPAPTPELYVNDYAKVLSDKTRARILEESRTLKEASGAQIAILTIPSLEGQDIKDYGYRVASSWKLGDAQKDNGLLILLAVQDRKIRVEVGEGLEGCLPDARVGRAIDANAVPAFKKNDFDAGIAALYDALIADVRGEYGLGPKPDDGAAEEDADGWEVALGLMLILLGFALLILGGLLLLGMVVDVVTLTFFRGWRTGNPLLKHFFLVRWLALGWWLVTFGGLSGGGGSSGSSWGGGSGGSGGGSWGGGGSFGGGGSDRSF